MYIHDTCVCVCVKRATRPCELYQFLPLDGFHHLIWPDTQVCLTSSSPGVTTSYRVPRLRCCSSKLRRKFSASTRRRGFTGSGELRSIRFDRKGHRKGQVEKQPITVAGFVTIQGQRREE